MKKNLTFTALFSVLMVFYLSIGTTTAQTWEATNGPFGGNVSCLTTNGSYLFAGTAMGVYGRGIFRSADNGANWAPVNNGLANTDVGKWVLAITASGSYIVASTSGGVYRSSDNGNNWALTNFSNYDGAPTFFVTVGTTLFAGTMTGIFVSMDNGLNWTARNNGWPNGITSPSISGLVYNGTYLYAGAEWTGVFYSGDLGMTWNDINYDLPASDIYTHKIAVKGNDVFDATDYGV
ncbi:MAG: WD40/YVTN/BNR-like repeat-containing protein, partial [Bacteroidales bacterium]